MNKTEKIISIYERQFENTTSSIQLTVDPELVVTQLVFISKETQVAIPLHLADIANLAEFFTDVATDETMVSLIAASLVVPEPTPIEPLVPTTPEEGQ